MTHLVGKQEGDGVSQDFEVSRGLASIELLMNNQQRRILAVRRHLVAKLEHIENGASNYMLRGS